MSAEESVALLSHLMRRAGFGATPSELDALLDQGYEETVEHLLHPASHAAIDEDELYRYMPMLERPSRDHVLGQIDWLYRMVNTSQPLREKIALFWHHVFATGISKVESTHNMMVQVQMFREHGLGSFKRLLTQLSQNPPMLLWLDNQENHKDSPNENWGRELLELFSMGAENYTELDVQECARAFTGWNFIGPAHNIEGIDLPGGPFTWGFEYRPDDHDSSQKTFLGHRGDFNGEQIIDIIVQQPACHRFVARHIYNFFVADEPPVATWSVNPPQNPEAIDVLCKAFVDSGYEIKAVLRTMFNSDFFKESLYRKIKSPAEVVASTIRLAKDPSGPDPKWLDMARQPGLMGQALLDPPTVEGWHTGEGWVNGGTLVERVNFAADRLRDTRLPGVRDLIERVLTTTPSTPEALVDRCLETVGPLKLEVETRNNLLFYVESKWTNPTDGENGDAALSLIAGEVFGLIASTREYQFG